MKWGIIAANWPLPGVSIGGAPIMMDNFMLILGEGEKPGMRWLIARKYGYLSLVGSKYWESLQQLTPGDRVFPYMKKSRLRGCRPGHRRDDRGPRRRGQDRR